MALIAFEPNTNLPPSQCSPANNGGPGLRAPTMTRDGIRSWSPANTQRTDLSCDGRGIFFASGRCVAAGAEWIRAASALGRCVAAGAVWIGAASTSAGARFPSFLLLLPFGAEWMVSIKNIYLGLLPCGLCPVGSVVDDSGSLRHSGGMVVYQKVFSPLAFFTRTGPSLAVYSRWCGISW